MFVPTKKQKKEMLVNKSRFICLVFPIQNKSEVGGLIKSVQEEYPKATHYLSAYQIDKISKSDNDNEPGNIARGFINLISQHQLDHILVVVVRYFGGIKLGASNLLRTYLQIVNETLKSVSKGILTEVYCYRFITDYKTFNQLKKAGYTIEKIRYFDKIEMEIISKRDILAELKQFSLENLSTKKEVRIYDE